MLILFDIDATLIKTRRAGLYALQDAISDLFERPVPIEGIEFAGRLDPLIVADMLRGIGVEPGDEILGRVRVRYGERLEERLSPPGASFSLPGVVALLDALVDHGGPTLGLLTGNFEETGRAKVSASGIDTTPFVVNAFGDESPHDPPARRHLPPVAIARYRERTGRDIDPGAVTILGDTPSDVDCALANGCRSLAVATGLHSVEELGAAGSHRTVEDLSATDDLFRWLLEG